MSESAGPSARSRTVFARVSRQLAIALGPAIVLTLLLAPAWKTGAASLLTRMTVVGLTAVLTFGVLEQWPRRLPAWIARWVLQVVGVGIAMPLTTLTMWIASTKPGAPAFWLDADRLGGFLTLTVVAVLVAPWAALAALVRQREAFARHQSLTFALERSELERQAVDARLQLLQTQVAPHFLFNTLANVQALVDAGSPSAAGLLRSLTAYLRAAVPLLDEPLTTVGREVQLVDAYLQLMHMRMPDRLQYELHIDESARAVRCPPTTLLTLVENAVRHGIDPSEEGGRIEITAQRQGDRCVIRVSDSGVGLPGGSDGLGTGLATLRERLRLIFPDDAQLLLRAREPRGVCAELNLPARGAMN